MCIYIHNKKKKLIKALEYYFPYFLIGFLYLTLLGL